MRPCGAAWTRFSIGLVALALGVTEARAQGRIPNFPLGVAIPDSSNRNGAFWLGGDSPFGTSIAPDVSFWAFGDTFLGNPGTSRRDITSVVANTIAIGQITGGNFAPRYFYRGSLANKQAFFPNPDASHKYWPKASIFLKDKLYVFLSRMYTNPLIPVGDPLGALDTGTIIARVNNPLAIPTQWHIEFLVLHVENRLAQANLKPVIEVLPAEGEDALIVYGFFNNAATNANKSVVLLVSNEALRSTPAGAAIDPSRVQYLAAEPSNTNPRWRPGFGTWSGGVDDYFDTQIDSVSGFTVRWNAALGKWQVVGANSQYAASHAYPKGDGYVPIPHARIFVHPTPFGPFVTSPQASNCYFHTFPELKSKDESLYVYCARQWQDLGDPRYNTDANLLLTYTYSSRDVVKQLRDPNTYQNKFVLLPNPYSGPPGSRSVCAPIPSPVADVATGSRSTRLASDPFGSPDSPKPLAFPVK